MENTVAVDKNVIDVDFLRSIIENDFEFEKELFAIFTESAKQNLDKMENAVKLANDNAWYMSAHAFKGASASIGAFNLSRILEYAQKHPEENYEQKTNLIKRIKEELAEVFKFINVDKDAAVK